MIVEAFLTGALGLAAPPPDDVVSVNATVAGVLAAGGEAEVHLEVTLADGWSASDAGIPRLLLQIDVPPSVTLTGRVVTGRALARNEFLMEPFERMIDPGATTVGFTLTGTPAAGARLGLNVLAYLTSPDGEQKFFARRRVEVPVAIAAKSVAADANVSRWGPTPGDGAMGLHIGDRAPAFTLPRADGSTYDLGSVLGRKNIIVTTYRAFW